MKIQKRMYNDLSMAMRDYKVMYKSIIGLKKIITASMSISQNLILGFFKKFQC